MIKDFINERFPDTRQFRPEEVGVLLGMGFSEESIENFCRCFLSRQIGPAAYDEFVSRCGLKPCASHPTPLYGGLSMDSFSTKSKRLLQKFTAQNKGITDFFVCADKTMSKLLAKHGAVCVPSAHFPFFLECNYFPSRENKTRYIEADGFCPLPFRGAWKSVLAVSFKILDKALAEESKGLPRDIVTAADAAAFLKEFVRKVEDGGFSTIFRSWYENAARSVVMLESEGMEHELCIVATEHMEMCDILDPKPWPQVDSSLTNINHGVILSPDGRTATGILEWMFEGKDTLYIPEGVEYIANSFLQENNLFENVVLPESLRCIGDNVMWSCSKLKRVVIPENVEYIGRYFLDNCKSLEDVAFTHSNRMATLPHGFLFGCLGMKRLVLPSDLAIIEEMALAMSQIQTIEGLPRLAWKSGSALHFGTDAPKEMHPVRNYGIPYNRRQIETLMQILTSTDDSKKIRDTRMKKGESVFRVGMKDVRIRTYDMNLDGEDYMMVIESGIDLPVPIHMRVGGKSYCSEVLHRAYIAVGWIQDHKEELLELYRASRRNYRFHHLGKWKGCVPEGMFDIWQHRTLFGKIPYVKDSSVNRMVTAVLGIDNRPHEAVEFCDI